MSLETWKKAFYPVDAYDEIAQKNDKTRLEHSIRKWKGLRKVALRKHGVVCKDRAVHAHRKESPYFLISGSSCSLCAQYAHYLFDNDCRDCPLLEVSGEKCGTTDTDAYNVFSKTGDPEPMISLLEKALLEIVDSPIKYAGLFPNPRNL